MTFIISIDTHYYFFFIFKILLFILLYYYRDYKELQIIIVNDSFGWHSTAKKNIIPLIHMFIVIHFDVINIYFEEFNNIKIILKTKKKYLIKCMFLIW